MHHLFWSGWQPLVRIFIVGFVSYVALIVMLRLSGKRTLSRMNAYDMVVTMALGSILTKAMLTQDQSISESIMAIFCLIAFQYLLSVAACHWPWVGRLMSGKQRILYDAGAYLHGEMARERVTQAEIEAAVHQKGLVAIDQVHQVILGANGQLSIVVKPDRLSAPLLATAPKV